LTWANVRNDMTLLFKLGKQKYALKERGVQTIADVAVLSLERFVEGPGKIPRVGLKTLEAWKRRAIVWQSGKPIIHTVPRFKPASIEVFYDIEDDPSHEHRNRPLTGLL
jgi:hypothetical protein